MTIKHSPKLVEKVAQALYLQAVERARDEIGKLQFEAKDMVSVFDKLRGESETGQILIFGSYLEDKVTTLWKLRLRHLSSGKEEDRLFGSNGPLETFGNRISMAYHLGWLSADMISKLDAFKKVRNAFAHNAFRISFGDPFISSQFQRMKYDVQVLLDAYGKAVANQTEYKLIAASTITRQTEDLTTLAMLASYTFEQMLVLPVTITLNVSPESVMSSWDTMPENIKELRRATTDIMLQLLEAK